MLLVLDLFRGFPNESCVNCDSSPVHLVLGHGTIGKMKFTFLTTAQSGDSL